MIRAKLDVIGLVTVVLVLWASGVYAAGRVALVVGNGAYAGIGTLPNPGNDATDVAAALGRLGFEVTTVRDAERTAMTEALRWFTRESAGADVSVVFYAGHGLEMDGVNYLVPVDARLERDTDVRFEAIELSDVLAATEGAALRVVILDACRNNPLARSMQRTSARRSVSRGSFGELDENLLGDETLVAYAAAAGTTAADGRGRNSPYTAALLAHLEEPLELSAVFRQVRARVLAATDGEQRPHEYASLLGEHFLSGTASTAPAAADSANGASATARLQQENLFWESIRGSTNPTDFEEYLRQFPAGVYRGLATSRLAGLRPAVAANPSASRPLAADSAAEFETFRDCLLSCPQMVSIPAGTFRMGCVSGSDDCSESQRPAHEVQVASFALSRYEITRIEYLLFVVTTGYESSGRCRGYTYVLRWAGRHRWEWKNVGSGGTSYKEPIVCVSWDDATAYARWLSEVTGEEYRLPSESEWEYAARAGTTTHYYWGDRYSDHCAHGNGADGTAEGVFERRHDEHTFERDGDREQWSFSGCMDGAANRAVVGSYRPNAFGLYDMAGNAWEWVEDCWHDNYAVAPSDGSSWTSAGDCGRRVLRGGSWSNDPRDLRSAHRIRLDGKHRSTNVGFRVARTLDY